MGGQLAWRLRGPPRLRRKPRAGRARQQEPARTRHPRPLRAPRRSCPLPPRLSRADAVGDRGGPSFLALDRPARGRPCRPRRRLLHAEPGRGRARLPDHDDLRRCGLPETSAGPGARVAAQDHRPHLRPAQRPGRREAGPDHRHGDDREAGRFGCPRQHDDRHSGRARGAGAPVRSRRPQVLRLGADVRRLSRAGPGALRALLASSCRAGARTGRRTRCRSCG